MIMSATTVSAGGCRQRFPQCLHRALVVHALAAAVGAPARVISGTVAAETRGAGLMVLSLPGKSWGVALDLQDFVINESRTHPEGTARAFRAERRSAGVILSTFIVPAPAGDNARACR